MLQGGHILFLSGRDVEGFILSTGQHNRVPASRVVFPAVFRPESTKKLDAGLKIAGMTSGEMAIFCCGGVLRACLGNPGCRLTAGSGGDKPLPKYHRHGISQKGS